MACGWLADCSADELVDALARRHGLPPELLLERARDFPHGARRQIAPRQVAPRPIDSGASFVEGAYACYSYSFTPYFPGWLIRSSMIIGPGHGVGSVAYSHNMPPEPTRFTGNITFNGRGMQIALHQTVSGDMRIHMALFGPAWHWTYIKATYKAKNGAQIDDENFIAVPDVGVARKRISGPDGKVIMIMDMTMKSTTKQAYEILTTALLKKAGTAAK